MTFVNSRAFAVRLAMCVLMSLLAAGCASYRVATSLPLKKPAAPMPADTQFRIAAVKFVTPTNVSNCGLPAFGTYQPGNEEIRNKLMVSAMKAYPKVFSEEPAAIPVEVTVTRSANSTELGGEVCASCLTLTILPLRSKDRTEYTVQVQVVGGAAGEKLAAPISFSREDTSWMSIVPTGWIPVPGGKGARAWGMDSAIQKGGDLTLSSCVEAIVTAIRRVDAETWQRSLRPGENSGEKK